MTKKRKPKHSIPANIKPTKKVSKQKIKQPIPSIVGRMKGTVIFEGDIISPVIW